MQSGDFVRLRFISESGGVQMINQHYIVLDEVNLIDPLDTVLHGVAQNWWDAVKNNMATTTVLAAMLWDNLSRVEQFISYEGGLIGTATGNAHPQYTILPVELYALVGSPGSKKLKRNRVFLGGMSEERSVRGRLIDTASVLPLTSYFLNNQTTGGGGIDYTPVIRYQTTPGPPPTYAFAGILSCVPGTKFGTHQNRKSQALSLA